MTLDKRTVALGIAAAGAVAAAVTVTVFDRSAGASPQRAAVTTYINRVNAIQNAMSAPLTRVMLAYKDFTSQRKASHHLDAELTRATKTLDTLERRLAAVPAPPEARKLRRLLVKLVDRQAAITHEVAQMAVFAPAFSRLVARAHAANARLGAALRAVTIPKSHAIKGTKAQILAAQKAFQAQASAAAAAQAKAIDAYDAELGRVVGRLRKLDPPAVLAPGYRAQLQAFRALRSSGARLAAELRQPNRSDVATLGRKFTIASRIAQSTAAQKAQIAAIKQYNARARSVGTAAQNVQLELSRLQTHLP